MAKKIYVGNVSYTTTDESLREAFAQHGDVTSATVVMDKMSGKSRGFGFVEMSNDDEALAAINAINGKEVDGRVLKVNEAYDKKPDGGNRGGGGRFRDNRR
jgi:cold-inducible RNA-binding protein